MGSISKIVKRTLELCPWCRSDFLPCPSCAGAVKEIGRLRDEVDRLKIELDFARSDRIAIERDIALARVRKLEGRLECETSDKELDK